MKLTHCGRIRNQQQHSIFGMAGYQVAAGLKVAMHEIHKNQCKRCLQVENHHCSFS